jgi:CHAD domain-containing protein
VLGEARDVEVLRLRLDTSASALDLDLRVGPVLNRIDTELGRRARDARGGVLEALNADRYFALLDHLDALLADPPLTRRSMRRGDEEAARLVDRAVHRVRRTSSRAAALADGEERSVALHDVRKAAKRARYAAESAEPVLGRPAARLATRMEAVQNLLGEVQDSVAARATLRQLGMVANLSHENGFTFGLLHAQEACAADHALADHAHALRRALRPWRP